jgi:cytochrome P450
MMWLGKKGLVELTTPLIPWAVRYQAERVKQWNEDRKQGLPPRQNDLLDTYMAIHHANPQVIKEHHVTELGLTVGFAGSESTGSALSALIYMVITHREIYKKLVLEVCDPAHFPDATAHVSYAVASKLPYFDACVKESFRLHPPGGAIMERVVPPGGARIGGYNVPGGTIVGCNPRPVQRDPELFGPDPDTFRPERWLVSDNPDSADKRKVHDMWAAMLHFGGGVHTCMGKHISLLEIYKIGVTLFRQFDVRIRFFQLYVSLRISLTNDCSSHRWSSTHPTGLPNGPIANLCGRSTMSD